MNDNSSSIKKSIVLTGGGSAGHVIPALALVPHLSSAYEIYYIGGDGIEKDIVATHDIPFSKITTVKLRRSLSISNLLIPFKLSKGISEAKKVLRKIMPDVVFSKGGFVSLPVVIAAHRLKIPVIAHESDMTAGLANKLAKKYCTYICTTFETTAAELGEKGVFTGSPLREKIYSGERQKGLNLCGFENGKPMLLVIGGSLGAVAINNVLRTALPALTPKYNICHVTGKGNIDSRIKNNSYFQIEFTDSIPHLFAAADVVIGRAGSNAVCEVMALKKPSLLIPLPRSASRGDQILNAEYCTKRNLAAMLPQEQLTSETLTAAIEDIYTRRHEFISALNSAPPIDGTSKIVEIIKSLKK